jgi:hypothetical protein
VRVAAGITASLLVACNAKTPPPPPPIVASAEPRPIAAAPVAEDAATAVADASVVTPCENVLASGRVKDKDAVICLRIDKRARDATAFLEDASGARLLEGWIGSAREGQIRELKAAFRDVNGDGIAEAIISTPYMRMVNVGFCRHVIDTKVPAIHLGYSFAASLYDEADGDPWKRVSKHTFRVAKTEACAIANASRTLVGFKKNATADAVIVSFGEHAAPQCMARPTNPEASKERAKELPVIDCAKMECAPDAAFCTYKDKDPTFYLFARSEDGRLRLRAAALFALWFDSY